MEGWQQHPSIWKVRMECSGMGDIWFVKHFDEPTGFSYDLLNDGPYQNTAKNSQTQSSLDDNDEDQDDDNRPLIHDYNKQDCEIDHEGSDSDRTNKRPKQWEECLIKLSGFNSGLLKTRHRDNVHQQLTPWELITSK